MEKSNSKGNKDIDDDDFGDFEEFEDPSDVKFPTFIDPDAPADIKEENKNDADEENK